MDRRRNEDDAAADLDGDAVDERQQERQRERRTAAAERDDAAEPHVVVVEELLADNSVKSHTIAVGVAARDGSDDDSVDLRQDTNRRAVGTGQLDGVAEAPPEPAAAPESRGSRFGRSSSASSLRRSPNSPKRVSAQSSRNGTGGGYGVGTGVKAIKAVGGVGIASLKSAGKVAVKAGSVAKNAVLHPLDSSSRVDLRWEQLQAIERRRRRLLLYEDESFFQILSHWDGTVLSHLKADKLLWFTLLLFAGVRIAARLELPDFVASLGGGDTTVISSFLTFFLVFYVNQTHSRYTRLYNNSMGCKGRIFDTASLARSCLPKERANRIVRYLNASHAAGYVGLSQVYPARSYFDHVAGEYQFLTLEERQRMDEINLDKGGSAHRELVAWAILEVERAKRDGLLDNELANQFRENILQFRACMGQLYNAADLPIPFFYVHFICLLTVLYLPLFAVSRGINAGTGSEAYWVADIVSGLIVLLQSVFVIGLRVLAMKLSDPYGDDLVDLSVMFFIDFTWTQSNRILNARNPPEIEASVETEELLDRHRRTIGGAWDDGTANGLGGKSRADFTPSESSEDQSKQQTNTREVSA